MLLNYICPGQYKLSTYDLLGNHENCHVEDAILSRMIHARGNSTFDYSTIYTDQISIETFKLDKIAY